VGFEPRPGDKRSPWATLVARDAAFVAGSFTSDSVLAQAGLVGVPADDAELVKSVAIAAVTAPGHDEKIIGIGTCWLSPLPPSAGEVSSSNGISRFALTFDRGRGQWYVDIPIEACPPGVFIRLAYGYFQKHAVSPSTGTQADCRLSQLKRTSFLRCDGDRILTISAVAGVMRETRLALTGRAFASPSTETDRLQRDLEVEVLYSPYPEGSRTLSYCVPEGIGPGLWQWLPDEPQPDGMYSGTIRWLKPPLANLLQLVIREVEWAGSPKPQPAHRRTVFQEVIQLT
jgi:hypothetical protein